MIIKTVITGQIQENCYIIMDEESKEIAIIDPGDDGYKIKSVIDSMGGIPKFILLTHGHFDHVGATEEIADEYNIPFYINKLEEQYINVYDVFGRIRKADGYLSDGDKVYLGKKQIISIYTPGHSKGELSYLVDGNLFSGDALFSGSVGRSDFEGGNAEELINSIKTKLAVLDEDTKVYPGHGPSSTIGIEKRSNPYLSDNFRMFF